jgi:hypothetical protein
LYPPALFNEYILKVEGPVGAYIGGGDEKLSAFGGEDGERGVKIISQPFMPDNWMEDEEVDEG